MEYHFYKAFSYYELLKFNIPSPITSRIKYILLEDCTGCPHLPGQFHQLLHSPDDGVHVKKALNGSSLALL